MNINRLVLIALRFNNERAQLHGLNIKKGAFIIEHNTCILDSALVAAYSLSLATAGGCSRIYLAGFDGFLPEDARNIAMLKVFNEYKDLEEKRNKIFEKANAYTALLFFGNNKKSSFDYKKITKDIDEKLKSKIYSKINFLVRFYKSHNYLSIL